MLLKIKRKFSCAHRLPNYEGKCEALHGHTWQAVFLIEGDIQKDGMVYDFKKLKQLADDVLPDHMYLNDIIENPTAENLANFYFEKIGKLLAQKSLKLKTLEIWESEDACAIAKEK